MSCFKGPTPPGPVLLAKLALPFLLTFCIIFSELLFLQRMVPKGLKMGASKEPKTANICKNTPSKRTHSQDLKKTLSGRGQTSKKYYSYTLSAVFSEPQGSHKGVKMEAKMEPRAPKITKKQEKRPLKKTPKTHLCQSVLLPAFWNQKGTSISWPKRSQNHNNPKNPKNEALGLRNESPGLPTYPKS